MVIAHRAGNDPSGIAQAARGADVVEADVHLFRGRLEVRHAKTVGPIRILWERWYLVDRHAPVVVLEQVLRAAGAAGATLMVDLKGHDPRLPRAVLAAIDASPARCTVIVCARRWRALRVFAGRRDIEVMHSVGTRRQLRRLRHFFPCHIPGGVSIDRGLLDQPTAAALRRRTDRLWTWTVDDPDTAATLAGWGVTGFISDAPECLAGRRTTRTA